MKKLIAILLVAATAMLCGCSANDDVIRFGAAGEGGVYHRTADSLSQLAAADGSLKIEVKTTAGSAANVRLLSQGYLDAAIAQSDIINDAYNGENSFSTAYNDYSALAALYTEVCHIIVRTDSDIDSVDDLLGKTVSVGEAESGSALNAKQILSAYGLNEKMYTAVNLNYEKSASQLVSGDIDALFWTVGINADVVSKLSEQCSIRIIGIDKAAFDKLKSSYPYFECKIPQNTYEGQNDEIHTAAVKSVLIVSNKLSDDKVKSLARLIFDNSDKIGESVSADFDITLENAVKGVDIPFHKGAAQYYSENGIEVNTAK